MAENNPILNNDNVNAVNVVNVDTAVANAMADIWSVLTIYGVTNETYLGVVLNKGFTLLEDFAKLSYEEVDNMVHNLAQDKLRICKPF